MPKLTIHEKGVTTEHELGTESVTLGRSSSCAVVIKDEQASREHCRIERDGDDWFVVDLGSSNGTRLDGRKIKREKLNDGSLIGIGNSRISFVAASPSPAAEPEPPAASAGTVPPGMQLIARSGPREGTIFEIQQPVTRIGRVADNAIVLDEPAVSKHHAEVVVDPDGTVLVIDRNSRNGIKVNKESVTERSLKHNDRLQIGATLFEFIHPAAAPADGAASSDGLVAASPPAQGAKALLTPRVKILAAITAAVVLVAVLADLLAPGEPKPRLYPDNLLTENPSFEAPGPGISGWITGIGSAGLDRKNVADGAQALRLVSATGAGSDISAVAWSGSAIPVNPAKQYEMSALVLNTEGESVALAVRWGNREMKWLVTSPLGRRVSDAREWRRIATTFKPPSWATDARFGVVIIGQGSARFDGLLVREAGSAPTGEAILAARLQSEVGPDGQFSLKIDGRPVFARGRLALTAGGRMVNQMLGVIQEGFPVAKGMTLRVAGTLDPEGKLPFTQTLTSDGTRLNIAYDVRTASAPDALVALEAISDPALVGDSLRVDSVQVSGPFENKTGVRLITLFRGPQRVFIEITPQATVSATVGAGDAAHWRFEFPTPTAAGRFEPSLVFTATTPQAEAAVRAALQKGIDAENEGDLGEALKHYQAFAESFPLYLEERSEADRRLLGVRNEIASRIKTVKSLANRAQASREDGDFESAESACTQLIKRLEGTSEAREIGVLLTALRQQRQEAARQKHEAKAAELIAEAKRSIEEKKYFIARAQLEHVSKAFPDTPAAAQVPGLLKAIPEP